VRVFFDATVFVYAVGGEHPLRRPCADLLTAVAHGQLTGETSALVVQEVVH
jgi:predicted nucleic acid-binding protein